MPILIWEHSKEQISLQKYCDHIEEKYGPVAVIVVLGYKVKTISQLTSEYVPTSVAITYTVRQNIHPVGQ